MSSRPVRLGADGFLLSGEFHYFRVAREDWDDRLATMRSAGLTTVSIYVPWNWHAFEAGAMDLEGTTVAERDLLGALEAIERAGLRCVFRPGPFITAEWRNGGIPQWLIDADPSMLALGASGEAATSGAYPALTYAHPGFRRAAGEWLDEVLGAVEDHFSTKGGPIVNIQLDDEPSYFQKLVDPLAVDFNPLLVDPQDAGEESAWVRWLQARYGSLEAICDRHGTQYGSFQEASPPRTHMTEREQLPLYLDWLYFKIAQVNDFVSFLYDRVRKAAPDVGLSMLYPYLQPTLAGEFSAFARERAMDIQLTNECYLALNAPDGTGEHKLGAVVACHEAYNMWRGPDQGPAVTMELQGSNATYIAPGSMEMLYATTVARGIRGVNIFMMVGGSNPPGYENDTGSCYDISAPVALNGSRRPHFWVVEKLARVVTSLSEVLDQATTVYDTWIGCWSGYEAAAMAGAAFVYDAWGHQVLANMGDMGLANANSLAALMSLSSVSFGCVDLEHALDRLSPKLHRQLWVPAVAFMPARLQEGLVDYARQGGHLVLLPVVPSVDERARPCTTLGEAAFGAARAAQGESMPGYSGQWDDFCLVRGEGGETLVVPGMAASLDPPPGAEVLARRVRDGQPCAFRRPFGDGTVSVLGFRLGYAPGTGDDQFGFLAGMVESSVGSRAAWCEHLPMAAMLATGAGGGILTVVNPVDAPAVSAVFYRSPGAPEVVRRVPAMSGGLEMDRRGGRMLPVDVPLGGGVVVRHSTWEVVGRQKSEGSKLLRLSPPPGDGRRVGEIVFEGDPYLEVVEGGEIVSVEDLGDSATGVRMASNGAEVVVRVG
jgi:beta-galactosidase